MGMGFGGLATASSGANSSLVLMHSRTGGMVRPSGHVTPRAQSPRPSRFDFPLCVDGHDLAWEMKGWDCFQGFGLILNPLE